MRETMFELTNFTVSILILMGWTCFVMYQRFTQALENNWPLLYWTCIVLISMKWPDSTWKFTYVAAGLVFCLLLRFEFINNAFANAFKACELAVFGYVLYHGVQLLYT